MIFSTKVLDYARWQRKFALFPTSLGKHAGKRRIIWLDFYEQRLVSSVRDVHPARYERRICGTNEVFESDVLYD
jgi:hypothetical protein